MTQWIERFRSHQIFIVLPEIDRALAVASDPCMESPALTDSFTRAATVIKHVQAVLEQCDPLLLAQNQLDNLATHLSRVKDAINTFVADKNHAHWDAVHANLDNCLAQLAAIPRQSVAGVEKMAEVATTYRDAVANWMNKLNTDGGDVAQAQRALRDRISEATAEINAQKQRLDNAISTFQQQFSDAQQSRQSEFSSAEQSRTQAAAKAEQERQERFDEAERRRTDAVSKATLDAEKRHDETVTKLEDDSKATLGELERLKAHAQKVVGIISDTGMAHGYQKTANEERAEAAIWKRVAAWSLALWITIGVAFLLLTYDMELTWAAVARQFLISTPFVLLAGFAAMQVSRHQKNERGLRQAELEIASLDPFLATLDDKERNEVKREFATRYFGQREVESKHDDSNPKLLDLAGALAKTLQELQAHLKR